MCIINLIICFSAVPLMSSASSSPRTIKQPPETPEMDEQNNKKWQEEISTGFDRLVAYATEVDKRRKSCDSNSPGFNNDHTSKNDRNSPANNPTTPEKQSSIIPNRSGGLPEEIDQFDNRMSTLSMKFKRAPNYQRYPGPPLRSPTSSLSSGSRHFAASSIPRDHDLVSPHSATESSSPTRASLIASSRGPLPGENLPEHHFKKRYFAQHDFDSPSKELGPALHEGTVSSSPLSPKKRLSMLGTKSSSSSLDKQPFLVDKDDLNRVTPEGFLRAERVETSSSKSAHNKDNDTREVGSKNPATKQCPESSNSNEPNKEASSKKC